MKNFAFVLTLLFIANGSLVYGQMGFGKPEDVKKIKERPLVVVLLEPNEKLLKKYRRKGVEKKYLNTIASINKALQDGAMAAKLDFHGEIVTKKTTEFDKILRSNQASQFAYMEYVVKEYVWDDDFRTRTGLKTGMLAVFLGERQKPVFYTNLPYLAPSTADIIYGFQQISHYLEARLKSKKELQQLKKELLKNNQLAHKTLLIEKTTLAKGVTAEKIKKIYPHKFKLVERAFIDDQIEHFSAEYAYVQIIPAFAVSAGAGAMAKQKYLQLVVSAENGRSLGYAAMAGFSTPFGSSNRLVTLKDIKRYLGK